MQIIEAYMTSRCKEKGVGVWDFKKKEVLFELLLN